MRASLLSFWLPKAGNTEEEYEDAFYPKKNGKLEEDILRFAVADGATESMLSGEWARILVKVYNRSKECLEVGDILARAYEGWDMWQEDYLDRRQRDRPIQWFEEAGLKRGAFSTFLGLTLLDGGRWKADVLGDTCLFQVRGNSLIERILITESSEFNNRPFLVPSKGTDSEKVLSAIESFEGNYQSNDRFYLMTDALACWFLQGYEEGNNPWEVLADLSIDKSQKRFNEWIDQSRKNRLLRNDDVTMVRIDIL